ncbi:hypothetical protein [Brevundimonas goettingensis]|uniref:DUF4337 domain-containing protein n=1 Tax=Brevundimonas goettingensis TaxID=2774190 RepID=A0A975C1S8_9CAUL|nr:hypothetical protein [Brevundimonas goettingensis]QTC90225.1 hypothetical protein IFJ75_13150 [Brevundimonas goettingensis]
MATAADTTAPQNTGSRLVRWIGGHADIASAVTLSIAGLLTSWSGYQAALWDGDQAAAYSQAGAIRTEASRRQIQAGQLEGGDALMFTQWLDAEARGDARLAGFYEQRFRPEYRVAHAAWRARQPLTNPTAPATPFVMPEYRLAARAEATALEAKATATFDHGQYANRVGDGFVRATVIFASALFFGGIGQAFRRPALHVVMLAISVLQCLWGVIAMIQLPVN